MTPADYVKHNCYLTCEADESDISPSLKEIGENQTLMASDCPRFESEFPHTVARIRARTDLAAKQKDHIPRDYAAKRQILQRINYLQSIRR